MICAQRLKSFFCKCNLMGPKIQWQARFHCLHFFYYRIYEGVLSKDYELDP